MMMATKVTAAEIVMIPTPASTRITLISPARFRRPCCRRGGGGLADGDGAVFHRAERTCYDVVPADGGRAGRRPEPRGGHVDFGALFRAGAVGREDVHLCIAGSRHFRVGLQVVR